MDPVRKLAPCFIGSGTLSSQRDMLRALETLEAIDYSFEVDSQPMSEGSATLVKLIADEESATVAVNGCLFLNVSSFRYLDFETDLDGECVIRLYGDGTLLELRSDSERDADQPPRGQLRMLEDSLFDLRHYVVADDDDEDF